MAPAPVPILHVKDEEYDVFFVERALQSARANVAIHVVSDGSEAQDYLAGKGRFADRAEHPLPVLVLMDIKLPKRTGLEVLEWMKAQPSLKHLPVYILTSSAEPRDKERAFQLGIAGYIVKPPGLGALVTALADVMLAIQSSERSSRH